MCMNRRAPRRMVFPHPLCYITWPLGPTRAPKTWAGHVHWRPYCGFVWVPTWRLTTPSQPRCQNKSCESAIGDLTGRPSGAKLLCPFVPSIILCEGPELFQTALPFLRPLPHSRSPNRPTTLFGEQLSGPLLSKWLSSGQRGEQGQGRGHCRSALSTVH